MEIDYNRVMQWQKWRTSPIDTLLNTAEAMKEEEKFALEWVGTKDVYEALRIETIRRVGSKDEYGREIDKANKAEKSDDNEDEDNEEDEDEDTDDADADDENDDDDDDDDTGNDDDNHNGGDPNYDSESPLLVGPDYNEAVPERSSSHNSTSRSDDKRVASLQAEEVSNTHLEDLSRAIVPHVQPMDETPIKREDATLREAN
ncbi:PREDICTED: pheromone-processing carboxypeptidase KEX1-like [Ipomoea nil]|uniref:pheromone-processing carboxypeptidase KEX1-like n=1 Tax=Ipomoea nil TaxID=35883 RepID=UPI0009010F07|nr:PREDICTED: pheromone-processing carboxypeptidase KEX1-like [Ipomoea nil]